MVSTTSPLERERSIKVIPGSCSASSQLTNALFEERTKTSSRLTGEGYISSLSYSRDSALLGSSSVTNTNSYTTEKFPEENGKAKQMVDVTPGKTEKDESSSVSSEKENKKVPQQKDKKKKRISFLRFLRATPVPGKSPRVLETRSKKNVSKIPAETNASEIPTRRIASKSQYEKNIFEQTETKSASENLANTPSKALRTLDKMIASPYVTPPNQTTSESGKEALERAKQYTLMSTALLDYLKNDGGTGDVRESIQQAKLAYEYAMKARQLYNSVRDKSVQKKGSTKSLCDVSVNDTSVDSSHITEKAGNVTGKVLFGNANKQEDSSDIQVSRADTPLSRLLMDSGGKDANLFASPDSIEIEHDGNIRFETPVARASPATAARNQSRSQDTLQFADSVPTNEASTIKCESEAATPRDSTLSPLSSILGTIKKNVQKEASVRLNSITNENVAEKDFKDMERSVEISSEQEESSVILPTNARDSIESSKERAEATQTASKSEDEREVKRERSNIIHPPALYASHSSVSASNTIARKRVGTTHQDLPIRSLLSQDTESVLSDCTPSQEQSLHQTSTVKEMKEVDDREKGLLKSFPVIKCGSGLQCISGEDDIAPQDIKQKGSTRITAIGNKDEYERGRAARHEHKVKGQRIAGKHPVSLWQRMGRSTQAAREWTQEELKEVRALAREILNGEVNVIEEVNPFICTSGAFRVKPTFDDETFTTFSHGSGSLITDDEEQTYETMSDGSMVDTASYRYRRDFSDIPHEGFEVFEKNKESMEGALEMQLKEASQDDWKATFDEDWKVTFDNSIWKASVDRTEDCNDGSCSSFPLTREMKVVGAASIESESESDSSEESSAESDDSTVSSISSASLDEK